MSIYWTIRIWNCHYKRVPVKLLDLFCDVLHTTPCPPDECRVLHCVTVCGSVLRCVAISLDSHVTYQPVNCSALLSVFCKWGLQHTATYCNILQHTVTQSITICEGLRAKVRYISSKTATHRNTLQRTSTHRNTQHTLQHTTTHYNRKRERENCPALMCDKAHLDSQLWRNSSIRDMPH